MEDAILNFTKQLSWEPEVKNDDKLKSADKFIVCGMGGSALPAGILKANDPKIDLLIHRDYGLPKVPDYFLQGSLVIICSYSGETAETIDAFNSALAQNLNVAVITTGGQLLKLAQEKGIPHVELPATKIHPRMAVGYFIRALSKLMNLESVSQETLALAATLKPESLQPMAEKIAVSLAGRIPLIYTTSTFYSVAYAWKVNFNETSKIPAFANVLPEADHNEIAGFADVGPSGFNDKFFMLMIGGDEMPLEVGRRFVVTQTLYREHGLEGDNVPSVGATKWERIINLLLLGAWTSVALAKNRGIDPEANPTIEEFKRSL